MMVRVINSAQLFGFLKNTLPFYSFRLFVHILTQPYLSLFIRLPDPIKKYSEITLDGEKNKINDYAVRHLRSSGYRNVYYINRLHAKMIIIGDYRYVVIGSANFSARSMDNYEAVILISKPDKRVIRDIEENFLNQIIEKRWPAYGE